MYSKLFETISVLHNISSSMEETWVSFDLSGTYSERHNKSYFDDFLAECSNLNIIGLITFIISEEVVNKETYSEEMVEGSNWSLHINKDAIPQDINNIIHTFFYSKEKFLEWAKNSNPISSEYPFNHNKYSIEVFGIESAFGGSQFVVSENGNATFSNDEFAGIENNIDSQCHCFIGERLIIRPSCHIVTFGEDSEYSKLFLRNSIIVLAYSLCNEIYDDNKVVIRGVRRLDCKFGHEIQTEMHLLDYQNRLKSAVLWVYEKDYSLRHKLLLDRITLDLNLDVPLINGLPPLIQDALIQAQERYNFATYERQDQYYKELRDLLKDIKGMGDQCNQKLRSILSNLSRDILGALLLVGVTLMSRITELTKLHDNQLVKYVFYGYGIYFIASAILQLIVDCVDIYYTDKEFNYWKNISRIYISNSDFENHKNKTYGARLCKFRILYSGILIVYVALSILCFKAYYIWQCIQGTLTHK